MASSLVNKTDVLFTFSLIHRIDRFSVDSGARFRVSIAICKSTAYISQQLQTLSAYIEAPRYLFATYSL